MPKLKSGISAVDAQVLFEVSGAAMPSSEPLPNFSGVLDQRLATSYAMNDAMVPPAPGITPSSVPMMQPTACEPAIFFIIGKRGSFTRIERFGFAMVFVTPLRDI